MYAHQSDILHYYVNQYTFYYDLLEECKSFPFYKIFRNNDILKYKERMCQIKLDAFATLDEDRRNNFIDLLKEII
jgi:hypothetical protein